MDDETLESYIRQYIEGQNTPEIIFSWQGGEPTMLGSRAKTLKLVVIPQALRIIIPPLTSQYKWGDNERFGNIGDLFLFDNASSGDKELFMLTGLGDDLRYWYFPSNKGNNKFWTYISDIE